MPSLLKKTAIICAVTIFSAVGCSGTSTDTFPSRDIEIVIPYNAGGGFDSYVRALAPHMEKYLPGDINILPINVPGAGGRRGAGSFRAVRSSG